MPDFDLMLYIAKKSGLFGKHSTSTIKISKEFGMTQQSISRKLAELEDDGMIKRIASPKGIVVSLDAKGRKFIQDRYREMTSIFDRRKMEIKGKIVKGMGESKYYMNQPQYQEKFMEMLGFAAYPGTVNLKVDRDEVVNLMSMLTPVHIAGFTTAERTFGSIECYPVKFNRKNAAIIIPERTRYDLNTVEIIADVKLMEELRLKIGDRVVLSV